MNKPMFKSLKNARRIASISNDLKEAFESLTFATATKEVILSLIERVREKHGNKVAQSLAEEISIEPQNEVELYRTSHIVTIARGFLHYRQTMKRQISKLTEEILDLQNTPIEIHALPDTASSTPWRVSIHKDNLLINCEDLEKVNHIRKEIEQRRQKIAEIKQLYYI